MEVYTVTSATSSSPTTPNGTIVASKRAAILTNSGWSGQNSLYSSPCSHLNTHLNNNIRVGLFFSFYFILLYILRFNYLISDG